MRRTALAALLLALAHAPAHAQPRIAVLDGDDPILSLGEVTFPAGRTVRLRVGIGSAAHRRPGDPADVVYTLSDRGPNFTCAEGPAITGVPRERLCAADRDGRVYPTPDYAPTLYGVRLEEAQGRFRVFEAVALKDADGRPLTGLTNPLPGRTETAIGRDGAVIPHDPSAVDAEGLFRAPDGTLWIGEENAPSVLRVAADGRVLARHVPEGTEGLLAGARYPVLGTLPAILARRQSNRGIEGLTGAADGSALYAVVQNPLANPDAAAFRAARNARLLRIDPATGRATGEWVYRLEDPRSFRLDPSDRPSDPRISELLWLGPERLLVLERTEGTTKLFAVRLDRGATDILGSRWDGGDTRPTLEQLIDLDGSGVVALEKRLVFDSADHPELPVKLEGMALLPDGALLLVNDDDFGITGQRTRLVIVRGLALGE